MRIEFVEISIFRKLLSAGVGLSPEKTVFVGTNNSGKYRRARHCVTSLALWPAINAIGAAWEVAHVANQPPLEPEWGSVLAVPRCSGFMSPTTR